MKNLHKAKTRDAESGVQVDPGTIEAAEPFVVTLWDETNIKNRVSLPNSLWSKNRKTGFPNVAMFRLGGELDFRQGFRWNGFDDEAVFIVLTAPCELRVDPEYPYPVIQRSCCQFMTARLRGKVPLPNTTPPQIIEDGFEGVLKTIETMWPTARRLIATSLSRPPKGWELFQQG
jgi:hypothetical protein